MAKKDKLVPKYDEFGFDDSQPLANCCAVMEIGSFYVKTEREVKHGWWDYNKGEVVGSEIAAISWTAIPQELLDRLSRKFRSLKKQLVATTVLHYSGGGKLSLATTNQNQLSQAVANYILPRTGWRKVGKDFTGSTGNKLRLWVYEKPVTARR